MLLLLAQLFLLFIPTNIMGLYVAAGIQGKYPPLRTLIVYGAVAGTLLAVFRALPWPFGWHSPAITVTLIIMVRYITRGTWGMAVLGVMICQVAAIIAEGLIVTPIFSARGLSLAMALQHVETALLGGWLANALLIPLVLIVYLRARRRPGTLS